MSETRNCPICNATMIETTITLPSGATVTIYKCPDCGYMENTQYNMSIN